MKGNGAVTITLVTQTELKAPKTRSVSILVVKTEGRRIRIVWMHTLSVGRLAGIGAWDCEKGQFIVLPHTTTSLVSSEWHSAMQDWAIESRSAPLNLAPPASSYCQADWEITQTLDTLVEIGFAPHSHSTPGVVKVSQVF